MSPSPRSALLSGKGGNGRSFFTGVFIQRWRLHICRCRTDSMLWLCLLTKYWDFWCLFLPRDCDRIFFQRRQLFPTLGGSSTTAPSRLKRTITVLKNSFRSSSHRYPGNFPAFQAGNDDSSPSLTLIRALIPGLGRLWQCLQ